MAVEFEKNTEVFFGPQIGSQVIQGSVVFSGPVQRAAISLEGWQLQYEPIGVDRQLAVISVETELGVINGSTVNYEVRGRMENQNAANPWSGEVSVLVIAVV
jgi:hypothetical protein